MRLKKGFRAEARRGASPADRGQRERIGPEVLEGMPWPMWHKVRVVHQMTRETKAGNDQLTIGFELIGSSAEGYVVWQGYNIDFKSKPDYEAKEWERLGETFAAAGLSDKSDTRELVGLSLEMFCVVPKSGFQPLEGHAWRPWQNERDTDYVPPPPKPPPRQAEPVGSHRYADPGPPEGHIRYTNDDGVEMEYEPVPEGSKTEWSPKDDPDDGIPF